MITYVILWMKLCFYCTTIILCIIFVDEYQRVLPTYRVIDKPRNNKENVIKQAVNEAINDVSSYIVVTPVNDTYH